MAHFLGSVDGAKGPASRLGTKNSGLTVVAASWQGAVKTTLYHNASNGRDYATVALVPWHGKGTSRILYDGPVDAPANVANVVLSGPQVRDRAIGHYDQHDDIEAQAERHENEKRHEAGVR